MEKYWVYVSIPLPLSSATRLATVEATNENSWARDKFKSLKICNGLFERKYLLSTLNTIRKRYQQRPCWREGYLIREINSRQWIIFFTLLCQFNSILLNQLMAITTDWTDKAAVLSPTASTKMSECFVSTMRSYGLTLKENNKISTRTFYYAVYEGRNIE